MHAAVVVANVDAVTDERLKMLKEGIVPRISSADGFVAGYWLEPVDGQGLSVVVFKDEAAAKAAAPPVGTDMGNGVTIASLEFRPVLGNA